MQFRPFLLAEWLSQMDHLNLTAQHDNAPRTAVITRIAVLEAINPSQLQNAVAIARQTNAGNAHRVVKQQQAFRRANRSGFGHRALTHIQAAVPQRTRRDKKKQGKKEYLVVELVYVVFSPLILYITLPSAIANP